MNRGNQSNAYEVFDAVALIEDMPTSKLLRGQVGTIVEILSTGSFEVEFRDPYGKALTLVVLRPEQLRAIGSAATDEIFH
jgi:hypothetical protein